MIHYWHLHLKNGSSDKVYEVIHNEVTAQTITRWGRRDAPSGQMQTHFGTSPYSIVTQKEAKGYSITHAGRLASSERQESIFTRAHDEKKAALAKALGEEFQNMLDSGKANDSPWAGSVCARCGKAPPVSGSLCGDCQEVVEHTDAQFGALDGLISTAETLIPKLADDPVPHLHEYAQLQEEAEDWRRRVQRLDSHLQVLEALLARELTA